MELQIRQVNPQDKTRWNQYIQQHPKATAYHNYAWVESVEQAYGHQNCSLIALLQDKVVGVLPIIKMQKPFTGNYLCSLPYCDIGHLLADSPQYEGALLEQLQRLAEQQKISNIQYRDSGSEVVTTEALSGKKVRMLLALPENAEQLMASFKSKLRSQIRKAEKNGLHYQLGNSAELLDAFYHVMTHNMRKLGSPVHSKAWFQALRENYQDDLLISVVYTEQTPIGAGIILRNSSKACIPWASTLAEYNRLAPNMLLYWSLLQQLADSGVTEFDFGRSTYGEGTFKFKRQWGAQPMPLQWHLPGQAIEDETTQGGDSLVKRIVIQTWSKLPIGVTTSLGPRIRKYISL